MKHIFLPVLASFLVLSSVSSCGDSASRINTDDGGGDGGDGGDGGGDDGGGGPTDPPPSLLRSVSADEANTYRSTYLPAAEAEMADGSAMAVPSAYSDVVNLGDLTYSGYMLVRTGKSNVGNIEAYGDVDLSIDMTSFAISGSAGNFMGPAPDENDVSQIVSYLGTLDIAQRPVDAMPDDPIGLLTDDGSGNASVRFDMNGTLESGLNTFVIDATLSGFIFGDNADDLFATGVISGRRGSFDGTVDGGAIDPTNGSATVSLNRN